MMDNCSLLMSGAQFKQMLNNGFAKKTQSTHFGNNWENENKIKGE